MRRPRHMLPTAIGRLDKMPALEQSRDRVLKVVLDEESTPDALGAAVGSDVAIVVAVMRLANARRGSKVTTVAGAVRALTPAGVGTLVRGIETYSFFDPMPGWALPPERFRLHAVSVAGAADMIAREIDHPNCGELYLAALLHDIGKVVMAEAYPDYELTREADCSPDERARAERLRYGIDHSVIGGVVLRGWRIPQVVARAVERHHAPQADGAAAVVRLADMLSHYERGTASRPAELQQAAAQLGIEGQQLRSLMYRLTRCGEPRRPRFAPSPLSHHERDALRGIASAKVYKQIACDLDLAPSTVRSHVHNACSKLGANSRAQAVLIATRHGWV
jgi:putative nucleotidyltransferase with HDIG domain